MSAHRHAGKPAELEYSVRERRTSRPAPDPLRRKSQKVETVPTFYATFRESDSSPKEHFVHHNAGASGLGGSSYIDAIILREQDANTAWTSASDGTLEQRRYYHQNWRADVIAMSTDTGAQFEGGRFSSYGRVFGMYAGDMNGDGNVDVNDSNAFDALFAYDVRGDMDRDGDNQADDKTALQANYGKNLGWGKLSYGTAAGGNRRGYAGYEFDPVAAWNQFHVRYRVLNADFGRWISRDPLGYSDERTLYSFASSDPIGRRDPLGLKPISPPILRTSIPEPDPCGKDASVPWPSDSEDWLPLPGACGTHIPPLPGTDNRYSLVHCESWLCENPHDDRYGSTGCCGGKRVAAICWDAIDGDFGHHDARLMIGLCVSEHERNHKKYLNCGSDNCDFPWCAASMDCVECYAFNAELSCIIELCGIGDACELCDGDWQCIEEMEEYREGTESFRDQYCGRCGHFQSLDID